MAEKFSDLYARACERKGGAAQLESMLSSPLHKNEVMALPDDRFLAQMTKKVFQSGFVWRVIEQKWPAFEEVFFNFDVEKILLMPDEMLEKKATDKRIVRNYKKVLTVRENALMISDVVRKHGSFGQFVAGFAPTEITQLWLYLKKHGARLGGNTGPYMLRAMGVDTFIVSQDAQSYFTTNGIISGSASSQRSLAAINKQFCMWQEQSERSLTQLSQILSLSWGENQRQA